MGVGIDAGYPKRIGKNGWFGVKSNISAALSFTSLNPNRVDFFHSNPGRLPDEEPSPGNGPSSAKIPDNFSPTPYYITFSDGRYLTIDFNTIVKGPFDSAPQITLPISFLDFLPKTENGKFIFPDNFCGIRVRQASSFAWLKDNTVVDPSQPGLAGLPPGVSSDFNFVPDNSSVQSMFDFKFYASGINFTGPIGPCSESNENWIFPYPLTKSNLGITAPENRLSLNIELTANSEIQFLNYQLSRGEALDYDELFSDEKKEGMEVFLNQLEFSSITASDCSIVGYVVLMCKEPKNPFDPLKCARINELETICRSL